MASKPTFPGSPLTMLRTMLPIVPIAYNGHTLEGILDEERIPGSLIPSKYLTFASTPQVGSTAFNQAVRLKERFEDWLEQIEAADEITLDLRVLPLIYALHQPPRRDFAVRKSLPKHVAGDRRDPIALIVTAVQLLHNALPDRSHGRTSLDIGLTAYVYDRLREAELVQISRWDVRFDALKMLSTFIAAVIAKYDPDCWASVETL